MSPRRNSVQAMAQHDALPPEWRALVADWNLPVILDARRMGWSVEQTAAYLEERRLKRQFQPVAPPASWVRARARKRAIFDRFNQFLASREVTP